MNTGTGQNKSQPLSAGLGLTPSVIAQLEQQGVSRDILVDVLLEDLNRRSTKRLLDLQRKFAPKLVPDRECVELSRRSDAERINELKAAFGEEGYLAWDKQQTLRDLNRARVPGDDLPMTAEEAERAYRLQKEYDDKNRELQMAMEDGIADRADASTLQAQAQQALDGSLEQLLGKKRFDALRGNAEPTTEVYRVFGDLNTTPDQAKAALQAEQDYRTSEAALTERLKTGLVDAVDLAAELKALSDAQEEHLRRIFGADAYTNVKRQNDPIYQTLQHYAEAWQLNDREIQSVYAMLTGMFDQTDRTRDAAEMREAAGQRVNWREINTKIEQTRQQAEAGLQAIIGGERLQRLKQNGVLSAR